MEATRSADGTTIAFDRTGTGPSLVLVGGALSDRGAAADLASHLDAGLTVIAYDRRGRGASTDTPPYAVEREIDDIDALIRAAGGSAFVFGHSSGAALALRAAEAALPIERLAVYEPPFIVDDTREPLPNDYVAHLEELAAAGRRADAVEYFMVVGVQVPAEMVTQMRGSPMWPAMESMAHTIAYDGRVMSDTMGGSPAPLRRWATLATPILVLDGGASPDWMRNSARTLAETLPNAEYRTLPGHGHGPSSSALAPELIEFFSGRTT
jgi:pimeloyl-ACP methyl ester carboxylesterase